MTEEPFISPLAERYLEGKDPEEIRALSMELLALFEHAYRSFKDRERFDSGKGSVIESDSLKQ